MNFQKCAFGSVCRLVNGKAFKPSDWSSVGVPIIRIQNLNDRDKPFNYWVGPLEKQVIVRVGDLLLAWSGTPGTSFGAHIWNGPDGILNQHIFRCDLDQRTITKEWAKIAVNHQLHRLIEQAHGGVGLQHVTRGMVEGLEIPIPPLPEQRRIAEILDRAEALRSKRLAAITQLHSLTQSLFLNLFGDPATNPKKFSEVPLASLIREDDAINYGVVQPGEDLEEGIPLIRIGDLIEGGVQHSNLKRIAPSIEIAYKRSRLRGDEILVSCVGSIGVVAVADESVKGFNIARAVARIPLSETTNRLFMAAYLGTDFVQRYFASELRTVSQPTLNIKQLSETTVVLPPIELQHEFARRVQTTEKLMTVQRAALAELDALFATLQHQAFHGEL